MDDDFFNSGLCSFRQLDVLLVSEVSSADAEIYYGTNGWKTWLLEWKYGPLSMLFYYLTLPTMLALQVRRMHDVGRAALIGLLPYIASGITCFYFAAILFGYSAWEG